MKRTSASPLGWVLSLGAIFGVTFAIAPARAADPAKAPEPTREQVDFFEKKVRPILTDSCFKCHSKSAQKTKGGLLLDTRAGMLAGGDTGPAIAPGNPKGSLLIKAVNFGDKDLQMPPKNKLSDDQIDTLTRWIQMGAPWPGSDMTADAGKDAKPVYGAATYENTRKTLWSWQPITMPQPPAVKNTKWPKTDIDKFILAKMEEKNLNPSLPTDRLTLLRRATFDLTGLPPTPDEMDRFTRDASPEAFAKVVDRLLASPRFGERWGRHWLDVARYADSAGQSRNFVYYYAWRYRDYVIKSFNDDKPYDKFIIEQLAGDLLGSNSPSQRDEQLIGTGFLAIGPKDYQERKEKQFTMNCIDEQIDAVGKVFLATTISCARCHDHKFDPIPTADYYSLAGIFRSTRELPGLDHRQPGNDKYSNDAYVRLNGFTQDELKDENEDKDKKGDKKDIAASIRDKLQNPPSGKVKHFAMGVQDAGRPSDCPIMTRGEVDHPGQMVKRGFLSLPTMQNTPQIPTSQSGRLQLAQWITASDNPLTARVMVNRIWGHLMGEALSRTVDNFGSTGTKPTHPELLDYMATKFREDNWSVKKMIRTIMLSSVYQQKSDFVRVSFNIDPDNQLLWHMRQRRLEAECIRDSILAASGKLDMKPADVKAILTLPEVPIGLGRRSGGRADEVANTGCRSVYVPMFRGNVAEVLEVFDMADPNVVDGVRDVTTVAPQALYLLNNEFVIHQAKTMVERLGATPGTDQARVTLAFQLTLGRSPTSDERDRAVYYLNSAIQEAAIQHQDRARALMEGWSGFCQALFACAEFRYIN